jgi:hypothetical protein
MRDILNLFDSILVEASRGLLYRSPGDEFFQGSLENPTAVMSFEKAEYYPSEPGRIENPDEFVQAVAQAEKVYPGIEWTNRQPKTGGFAVLTFNGPRKGQKSYYGRFFGEIKADMAGQWKNDAIPGGWQLKKASSLKGSYFKLKPSDLFPPNSTFDSPSDILEAMQANPKIQNLIPGMEMLVNNQQLPTFVGTKSMETAVRDDLGETIGPIALVQGMVTSTGAEAARKDILGPKGSWSGSRINFPASKTNGLVDSYIYTTEGIEVGLSSKGDQGATASIKNVADGIKIAQAQNNNKLLKKYQDQIKVINDVAGASAKAFPLIQGQARNYITDSQAQLIMDMMKTGVKNLDQVKISGQDRRVFEDLMKDIAPTANPRYNVGFHILASLARRVVADINKDPKFGEACLTFLNISPIIQLHMQTKTAGEDVTVTGFTSKYPPNFNGTVALDASKVYYATGVNGRCTFAYNGGGDGDDKLLPGDQPEQQPAQPKRAKTSTVDLDTVTQAGSDITARAGGIDPAKKLGSEKTLGRKRQK